MKAAVHIQQELQKEPKVPLRVGIHVGELFFEGNKVMGDSVNVASRIQSLACANSILFSKEVFDKLKNQPDYKSVSLGKFEFKNVEEVSTEIATDLSANITNEDRKNLEKNYTENIEAYKLYRKGRFFWDLRSRENYDSAEANYKRAIQLDPDYALAYAGLADCYTFNQRGLSQLDAVPIAEMYARKALELDNSLVEAQTTMAFVQSHFNFDWQGGKVQLEKIIQKNPNYPVAHIYLGNVLLCNGNIDAGLAETKKALRLDPLSSAFNHVLGRNLFEARKYDSAIKQLQKSITLNPRFSGSYVNLGYTYIQKKLYKEALQAFALLPRGPFDQGGHGTLIKSYGYAASGDKARSLELLNTIPRDTQLRHPALMAQVSVVLGNKEEALNYLEPGYQAHTLQMMFLKLGLSGIL